MRFAQVAKGENVPCWFPQNIVEEEVGCLSPIMHHSLMLEPPGANCDELAPLCGCDQCSELFGFIQPYSAASEPIATPLTTLLTATTISAEWPFITASFPTSSLPSFDGAYISSAASFGLEVLERFPSMPNLPSSSLPLSDVQLHTEIWNWPATAVEATAYEKFSTPSSSYNAPEVERPLWPVPEESGEKRSVGPQRMNSHMARIERDKPIRNAFESRPYKRSSSRSSSQRSYKHTTPAHLTPNAVPSTSHNVALAKKEPPLTLETFGWMRRALYPKGQPIRSGRAPKGPCLLCGEILKHSGSLQDHLGTAHRRKLVLQVKNQARTDVPLTKPVLAMAFAAAHLYAFHGKSKHEQELCQNFTQWLSDAPRDFDAPAEASVEPLLEEFSLLSVDGKLEWDLDCPYCKGSCPRKYALNKHITRCHPDKEPLKDNTSTPPKSP